MGSMGFSVGLSLFMVLVVSDSQICPVLEDRGITLTCTVLFNSSTNIFSKQFQWNKTTNGSSSAVGFCFLSNGCQPATNLPYTFTATSLNASSAIGNMIVASASRTDEGLLFCSGSYLIQDVPVCDLKVVATPASVSCSQPELHNNNVTVTCTGDRIYPQALCQFTWIKDGTQQSPYSVAVKNQTLSQSQNTDYFYPECTWTIPVQTLGFGSHQFHALIYPNVTGNTATDMSYGRDSTLTSPVEINHPEVILEPCPQVQDYIKLGTRTSCICIEINNTFLLADVHWSGFPAGFSEKQTSTLIFSAERNNPKYVCSAFVLGKPVSQVFAPLVAYGPDQVEMKVQINGFDQAAIDLCGKPPTSQTMTVSCTVSDVRPNATVRYFINGNDQAADSVRYINYPITNGGNFSVKCTAINNKYPEIYHETTTFLLVREPPDAPVFETYQPNLIVSTTKDQQQQLTVREGLVRIWCRVDGGYPNVTQLTLTCNGSSTTSAANTVFVEMNVTRKMNSQPCSCTATHEVICYDFNSASSTLNVLYPPTITSFTVTGAVNQEVQANTNVMFSCEAEGNPAFSLTLVRDSDSQILTQTDSNNKAILQFNKNMACQDSGIYVCKAQTLEDKGEETVQIYVLCKPQLAPTESQNRVYRIRANQTFDINITVIGYPEPQLLLLQSSTALKEGTYDLAYYTTAPGKGIINFKIYTFLEAYFQKYQLSITNKQGSFVYSFEIKAESVKESSGPGSSFDVESIVGGIIAGIVVILVAVVVYIAWRKGLLKKCIKQKSSPALRYTTGDYEENDPPATEYGPSPLLNGSSMPRQMEDPYYMDSDQASSPYVEIDDIQSDITDVSNLNSTLDRGTLLFSLYDGATIVADSSNSSGATDINEAQKYSGYTELEDETPGSAGIKDYINQGYETSHTGVQNENYISPL